MPCIVADMPELPARASAERGVREPHPAGAEPDTGGVPLVQALALELEFIHSFDHPIPEGTKPWGAPLHRERIAELIEQNLTVSSEAKVTLQTYRAPPPTHPSDLTVPPLEFTCSLEYLEYKIWVFPGFTQPGFKIVAGRWGEADQKKLRLLEATFSRFLLRRVAYVPRNYEIVTSEVMLKARGRRDE